MAGGGEGLATVRVMLAIDVVEWLNNNDSLGTIPAWFGGVAVLLTISLFMRDRRRDDREQIEKLAVWSIPEYQVSLPYHGPKNVDVRCVLRAKNSSPGIAKVERIAAKVSTRWAVRDVEQ